MGTVVMSALCQKRTHAPQQKNSITLLVREQHGGEINATRFDFDWAWSLGNGFPNSEGVNHREGIEVVHGSQYPSRLLDLAAR